MVRTLVNVIEGPPRVGPWLQTFTGRQVWPLDPRVEDIDIRDIAHALSNVCRFAGHTTKFYSVAEHCVILSERAPFDMKLCALLHDAPEAYMGDVPRPLKSVLPNYRLAEWEWWYAIALKFDLPDPIPEEIHRLDTRILADERQQIMAPMDVGDAEWGAPFPPLGVKLPCWPPHVAKRMFLLTYTKLTGERI